MTETQEVSATQVLLKKQSKGKAATVEQQGTDVLFENAQQIENLDKQESLDAVKKLMEEEGLNDFRLGGVLRHIKQNGWFDGFDSFESMIEATFGIKKRKASYLSSIYDNLVTNQIPWAKVASLGWTKLKVIADILTIETVDEWVAKAMALTTMQLEEVVKQFKNQANAENATTGDTVSSTVSTLTFKIHEDQKIVIRDALDKAKLELNTEYDTVALEAISIGYLGGSVNMNKIGGGSDLTTLMKASTYEEVLEVFSIVFPDVELVVTV